MRRRGKIARPYCYRSKHSDYRGQPGHRATYYNRLTRSVIGLWDYRAICFARELVWDKGNRWAVTCPVHATQARYKYERLAEEAARTCAFCPECQEALAAKDWFRYEREIAEWIKH